MNRLEFMDEYNEDPAGIVAENEKTAEQKFCLHSHKSLIKSCCGKEYREEDEELCDDCGKEFFLMEVCEDCGLEEEVGKH